MLIISLDIDDNTEGFITNFTKYEKSQITDKIKD